MATPKNSKKRCATDTPDPESIEGPHKKAKVSAQNDAEEPLDPTMVAFYEKSEFMRTEIVESDFYNPDLRNEIDPIYRKENFIGMEYEYIRMSARLATRYLRAEETWAVFDKIVNVKTADLIKLGEKNKGTQELYAYPSKTTLKLAEREKAVHDALARLAEIVSFKTVENLNGSIAETAARKTFPKGVKRRQGEYFSSIRMPEKLYNELVESTKSMDDPVRLLISQWQIATTLVHEVAHALCFSQFFQGKSLYNEKFFDADAAKAPFAETGFEVEHRLHGCIMQMMFDKEVVDPILRYKYPNGKSSKQPGILVVFPWPSNNTWNQYDGKGINRRKHAKLPEVDLVWRLDARQLAAHFRTSTWDLVARDGIQVLHLEKMSAYGFYQDPTDGEKYLQPRNPLPADVPEGYEVRESGDVMRKTDRTTLKDNPTSEYSQAGKTHEHTPKDPSPGSAPEPMDLDG